MILREIEGQSRSIAILRRVLAAGRVAHAYIFAGPPGVGKRATALGLAQALLCQESPGDGCDHCAECHLIAAGSHPDVFIEDLARARLERPTTNQLSIEQVRRVSSHLSLRPARGARKVASVCSTSGRPFSPATTVPVRSLMTTRAGESGTTSRSPISPTNPTTFSCRSPGTQISFFDCE